jgi:hypothetical protein
MTNLTTLLPEYSFPDVLTTTNNGQGLTDVLKNLQDGLGNNSTVTIATNAINFNRTGGNTFQLDGIPLTVSATILNSFAGGFIDTIAGTANQINVTAGANPVLSLASDIIGVNSITTTHLSPLTLSPNGSDVRIGQDGTPVNLQIRTGAELRLYSSANASYTGWKCPTGGPNTVIEMPLTNGNAGDVLTNDGVNGTIWSPPSVSNIEIFVDQIGHGFAIGDVIRLNGSTYVKAQADNVVNSEAIGIVTELGAIPTELFSYTVCGKFFPNRTLTPGSVYFLDPVTPGAFTATAPSTSGQVIKPLFIAISTTNAVWLNQRGDLIP